MRSKLFAQTLSVLVSGLVAMSWAGVDTLRQGFKGYTGCSDTYVHWYNQNGFGDADKSVAKDLRAESG